MLKQYNNKRNFKKTPEPKAKLKKRCNKNLIFVIQFHQASHDHYDFRLEYNGVLLSWAIPKGLPDSTRQKRLAVHVENHPLDYANFEGEIPSNQYGAGLVEIFDKGTYEPINNFKTGLKQGKLTFILHGTKFNGEFHLIKIDEKNWLILKLKNNITKPQTSSKINKNIQKNSKNSSKISKNPFKKLNPMLATLTDTIPNSKDYLFEIKYDGYRIISFLESGKVKLKTRNNKDYTKKFPEISKSLSKLCKMHSAVLDGEVVAFDETGKSNFSLLQDALTHKNIALTYVIFDILALDGKDLKNCPLIERKEILKKLMKICPSNLIFSNFVIGKGKQIFNFAKKHNLEGVMAKNVNSLYKSTRSNDWLKIKCVHRQEFVIVGYSTTQKNKKMSAILVGYYKNKKLIYAGKVGTGFTEIKRDELHKKFQKFVQQKCPLDKELILKNQNIVWLKPKLVCEIKFAELTKDNLLRQPSFVDLRIDKKPQQVCLEIIGHEN